MLHIYYSRYTTLAQLILFTLYRLQEVYRGTISFTELYSYSKHKVHSGIVCSTCSAHIHALHLYYVKHQLFLYKF